MADTPDRTIGQLDELEEITDTSLLPVEQSGTAYHTTGAAWKTWCQNAISAMVALVQSLVGRIDDDASRAENAAANAAADKNAISNMTVSSTVLPAGSTPTLVKQSSGDTWNLLFGLAPGAQGPQGPTGPAGPQGDTQIINYNNTYQTASVQPSEGTIYFSINDQGHLILTYAAGGTIDPNNPPYSIDYDEGSPTYGHLLWSVD